MTRAQAAILRQVGTPMSVETIEVGPLAPVDVRVRAASLSHTDLEALEGQLAVPPPASLATSPPAKSPKSAPASPISRPAITSSSPGTTACPKSARPSAA